MKTIKEIMDACSIKSRQAFYYRLKLSGIENKENYTAQFEIERGKPPKRIFTDEEAYTLIHLFDKEIEK